MTPRLKTSKKWTALPAELCAQVREVFNESFEQAQKVGQFHVEGRIYPEELCFRVGYNEKGRLTQANFEVSLAFNASKQNALEQIHLCVDCAASMLQEYFEREQDLEGFPRSWESFDVDGREVFMQITTVNTNLESAADKLLGKADDALVREDETEDEAIDRVISMLGLDKEDGEDFPGDDEEFNEQAARASSAKAAASTHAKTTAAPAKTASVKTAAAKSPIASTKPAKNKKSATKNAPKKAH